MKLRIGLVGCGVWGRNILRDLCELGCDVIVADTSELQRSFAASNGGIKVVSSAGEFPEVDGMIVATPATAHARLIDELLERRRPIFTEKPFTTDASLARRLTKKAPDQIFVMDVWRYHNGIQALRDIAQSGELGAVQMLRTTRTNWTSPRQDTDSTWTLLPHDLSIALEILGYIPEPRFAFSETLEQRPVGMIAILGDKPAVVVEVSNRFTEKRREVRLHCEKGVAILRDGDIGYIEIARETQSAGATQPAIQKRPVQTKPALFCELRSFVEFLRGGPAPKSSAADGLAIVETITQLRGLVGVS